MTASVLTRERIKPGKGFVGRAVGLLRGKEPPVIYGVRWSSRRIGCWGCRLASALAGTVDVCSGKFGVTSGDKPDVLKVGLISGGTTLGTVAAVCNAEGDCCDTCSGRLNVKRTGRFNSSASIASRGPTNTNMYPGASVDPTVKGRAGFPSTAIKAAPWPTLLAMTPDKTNLSTGLGPELICGNGDAPRSRDKTAAPVISGVFCAGPASAVLNTRAELLACAQNQQEITTDAQMRVVALRHPNLLYDLNIDLLSSHNDSSLRKSFQDNQYCFSQAHSMLSKYRRGFTLIELMVVLVIIGVLAALIVPNVLERADDARVMAARTDVNNLNQALKLYKLDNQRLPTTEQGLQALIVKPAAAPVPASWKAYLDKLPNDPWGRPYQYLNPGVKGEVDVMSFGADGQPGGEGRNADVGSWQ